MAWQSLCFVDTVNVLKRGGNSNTGAKEGESEEQKAETDDGENRKWPTTPFASTLTPVCF
jgi:hypothetical protein